MQRYTEPQVRALLREQCRKAGSAAAWAARHGINQSYVRHALAGKVGFGRKIVTALGLREVRVFVEERV